MENDGNVKINQREPATSKSDKFHDRQEYDEEESKDQNTKQTKDPSKEHRKSYIKNSSQTSSRNSSIDECNKKIKS